MSKLPRIALGSTSESVGQQLMAWAFVNVLEQLGLQVQPFLSQSRFSCPHVSLSAQGPCPRHLDSWLMSPEACRQLFLHGASTADLAALVGRYDREQNGVSHGGRFDTLCEWLGLPQLAIIDARSMNLCVPPTLPAEVDGLLLSNVTSVECMCRCQAELEGYFGVPVLGVLMIPDDMAAQLAAAMTGGRPTAALCQTLGNLLAPRLRLDRILDLVNRVPVLPVGEAMFADDSSDADGVNIAVAYDEAFHCYFADVLDLLEAHGAHVNVFSPLHSERLPSDTDVVYVGCGTPERFAHQLATNVCIQESIRRHVKAGGRVYAESAGLAYLCREMRVSRDVAFPMLGILPAAARLHAGPQLAYPVDVTTSHGSWLHSANEQIRGYLNPRWSIHPVGNLSSQLWQTQHAYDLVGDYQVVGSRLHLNFAIQPATVDRFFRPLRQPRLHPSV